MQGDTSEVTQKPQSARVTLWSRIAPLLRAIFSTIGGIANLLGIYTFGESRNWWGFSVDLSPEMEEVFWMLAVGLGGPWALMVGVWAGARFSELLTKDKARTVSLVRTVIDISFFLSIWHYAQMAFGLKIFSRYLHGEGFLKISLIYFLGGLSLGVIMPLIRRKPGKHRTQQLNVRKAARLRRSGS